MAAVGARRPPRLFFIHVMRTAGTSIREMLSDAYPEAEVFPNEAEIAAHGDQYPELAEATRLLRGAAGQRALVYGHYPYVFRDLLEEPVLVGTMLREPVARSISVLKRAKRRYPRFSSWTLDEMLDHDPLRKGMIENYQTKMFSIRHVGEIPSVNRPLKVAPWRLKLAKANLADCDFVGLTEDFDRSAEALGRVVGVSLGPGRVTNGTSVVHAAASPELIEKLRGAVSLDLELYQHARDLHERRMQRAQS